MTKEAFARGQRLIGRSKPKEGWGRESDYPYGTAPWDQPRNATTITLEGPGVDTCTEAELIERIQQRSPHLKGVQIDHINSRKPGFGTYPPTACLLISWENPSFKP